MQPGTICYILICILFFSEISYAQVVDKSANSIQSEILKSIEINKNSHFSNLNIGPGDSVFFDLASAYQLSTFIDVPIYFRSTSSIYALDFEIKYTEQRIILDSLIVHNTNLQYLYYYNPLDSILRFTSNSLTPLDGDSCFVVLRFEVLAAPMCSNDVQDVQTYLNGDLCSYMVSNCVISGTPEIFSSNDVKIFPNPANEQFQIQSTQDVDFQLFDMEGKSISNPVTIFANQPQIINTSNFPSGIYFYQLLQNNKIITHKLVISR